MNSTIICFAPEYFFFTLLNIISMGRFEKQRMLIPRSYLKFMDDMYNFPVKKDDIWIVTFPKCGTTWMQETVSMLINDVDEVTFLFYFLFILLLCTLQTPWVYFMDV